jgi:hypothetical protein
MHSRGEKGRLPTILLVRASATSQDAACSIAASRYICKGKISASTRRFGKDEANNKHQDVEYRTMQSVLTTAATLTVIIAIAGRNRRPTTEDLSIQKRKAQGQEA